MLAIPPIIVKPIEAINLGISLSTGRNGDEGE
jgi:hypothetical protein